MLLYMPDEQLHTFIACLSLGTLHAIRTGILDTDAGIWSLASPSLLGPLRSNPHVPNELIEVLESCDELSAIQQMMPQRLQGVITETITRIESQLSEAQPNIWRVHWDLQRSQ